MPRGTALWQQYGPSGAFRGEAQRHGVLGWCWRQACEGHSTDALAHMLGLSRPTVERHLRRYAKATGLRVVRPARPPRVRPAAHPRPRTVVPPEALARLSARDRELVRLWDARESKHQIAAATGLALGSVNTTLYRILGRVKEVTQ